MAGDNYFGVSHFLKNMKTNNIAPLPEDSSKRKEYPLYRGLFQLFPHALAAISHHTYINCRKHLGSDTPEGTIGWDKSKSPDELDAMLRHMLEEDWVSTAWRALGNLERELTNVSIYKSTKKEDD